MALYTYPVDQVVRNFDGRISEVRLYTKYTMSKNLKEAAKETLPEVKHITFLQASIPLDTRLAGS